MPLTAGDRLGPYEIAASIGAGGMGEVYRARDTRIGRDVAVKVSAERFSDRFDREARVIASLNHPNICTLHDVGPDYLVMELVEGPTLAETIQNGPVPLDEALAIARQIADALEAAHEIGIVHRDLKPGNIKVKPDGAVKVLDFGLAKVALASIPVSGDANASPTLTMAATQAGVILGTAAYMAPEQARGKPVDKRADIWAFGVVLYEMLTGRRLFQGGDITETLAAVIKDEPRWDAVPARARPLLRRCLERDPKKRLRDIGDAMPLLEAAPEAPAAPRRQRLWPAVAALGLVAAAAVALAFVYFREKPPAAEQIRFQIPLHVGGSSIAISPNGRRLAFAASSPEGRQSIWVREMDSLEPHRLAGTEDTRGLSFWSPDSRLIAFESERKLKKIDAAGGLPQIICDAPSPVIGGSWNRAGTIIVSSNGIKRVSDSGGTLVQVTAIWDALFPSFLPDGRHFVYLRPATPDNQPGIYLGSIDAKPDQQASKRLLATDLHAQYVPSADPGLGYILFLRGRALLAQSFDNRRLETAGEAIPIAEGVGSFAASALFSASENGVLAYRGGFGSANRLTWFDRQGKPIGAIGDPGLYSDVVLSPDGSRVAISRFSRQETGVGMGILLLDFSRGGVSTHLTFSSGLNLAPVWSPDGGRVAFNNGILYQKPSSGTGSEAVLLDRPAYPTDWSRDGRYLLYEEIDPKTRHDLWSLPNPGGASPDRKPIPILNSPFNERMGQFSPDVHWIAYVSDESGRPEIYVQAFPPSPSGGIKRTISQSGGDQPRWRRDGRELLFFAPDGTLMSVDVSTSGPTLTAGIPHPLFRVPVVTTEVAGPPAFHWDVSADGKKFLIDVNAEGSPEPVTIVSNWLAQLKK